MESQGRRIIGNQNVRDALAKVAASPHLGHAYLFQGPDGVGKRLVALEFARAINCRCSKEAGLCESCRLAATGSYPEILVLEDANKPRWFERDALLRAMGLARTDETSRYRDVILGLQEKGFLEEPLPAVEPGVRLDGFSIATDRLFGRGSVPSKECYTPSEASEALRKSYDGGNLSDEEYVLLRALYEYPLSSMPYRGTIPIAYVASRKGWRSVRPIQTFLSARTMYGGRKVVIVDDAHKMTAEAQNCLLKTLEEPPADSVIILVTSDRQSLFPTVVSRCQSVAFTRLDASEMEDALNWLLGPRRDEGQVLFRLGENAPGRLLDLARSQLPAKLAMVSRLFDGIACGKIESVFAFSASVLGEGPAHRKKMQASLRAVLEIVIFWIVEMHHAKRGLPAMAGSAHAQTLKRQALAFDETALLEAAGVVEAGLPLAALNIDMSLLADTVLLRMASRLVGSASA